MFINNFNPVAFQILSFEIRWYSLAYIVGIVIGWTLCKKIFIKNSDINEKFDDYITYLVIGIILGGRIGYIIFYNFAYYLDNILDIFKIWQGGMSMPKCLKARTSICHSDFRHCPWYLTKKSISKPDCKRYIKSNKNNYNAKMSIYNTNFRKKNKYR